MIVRPLPGCQGVGLGLLQGGEEAVERSAAGNDEGGEPFVPIVCLLLQREVQAAGKIPAALAERQRRAGK